jgi:signal transduction histidine kinase
LAVLLATVEVFLDWITWIELNVAIVYGLPLILAAAARSRPLLWTLMSILVLVTFVVYSFQIPPGHFSLDEPFFLNRVLAAVAMVLTAGLGHIWIKALETLEAQSRALKERNVKLDAANQELIHREELIARQNEELEFRRREAEEASSRKTRLLASVSHDIRTPVNAINLLAEGIRWAGENPAVAAQVPDLAQRLQANALSLAEQVADLIDLARLESGRMDLKEITFSLNDLLAGQYRALFPLAQAKGLRLETEMPEPPIWLQADRIKLSRVLSNLIGNGIKFTETGGVKISAVRLTGEAVLIQVQDTGIGIPPEQLERVFDEFAQIHTTEGDRTKGWGLGLAISRRLINAMGGTLTVVSTPGQGSRFTVRLPARCIAESPSHLASR